MRTKRVFIIIRRLTVYGFAIIGFVLVAGFFAINLHLTDTAGTVDEYNQDFQAFTNNLASSGNGVVAGASTDDQDSLEAVGQKIIDLQTLRNEKIKILCHIHNLGTRYPDNARKILTVYQATNDDLVQHMLFATDLELKHRDEQLPSDCDRGDISTQSVATALESLSGANLYPWINHDEWSTIRTAITKDSAAIHDAATVADIDPRLIAANLSVEQLRLFHSQRELFEKFFKPLNILGNATQISLGVMGIKEATAKQIEAHLTDANSPYYLGTKHEHDLDFSTSDIASERYDRLTDDNNHYYSYLYAGLYIKQMLVQWDRAGFPLDDRVEIIGTLFNVGFAQSSPKAEPVVGGSTITIGDRTYSFGSLSFEFYYSGELSEDFHLR